ncbi:MAG: diaminohydroxyphosphoribosylaminopyrimidine deaminase / 5-amino-6-(5-phosphoribosylamino)uracil reductase [Candidatus Peregrinibacteria bacterium Greene0416_62]|nr:MAG: diaminohydroxyphosphoribosylaminopyrimidine deaminase / 5-amino-6-(5-phosphoribosylamino)uracil reductase [Candidatus Peregrinibacteria bacterium Greene0416_62]TSC98925.1 MAG: diaminohydroxyphosphoribosylaminopyrimidine deaminase / 5-amino-6-(5-phosphoribosylamino)uracil reductase [Candidatus Peregrinibacteria bacterium Greene1014_49]
MNHVHFLHRCLSLAARARGHTGINPMVGAVLVRNGKIIAEAFHEEFGSLHAEALLIKKFVQKMQQEDRLYLNLEPCCHSGKKTPSCTEAIIKSGIKHVIIGMLDPNPAVCGKGIEELQKNGIEVIGPVDRARCEWFNRGFVSLMTKGRPWVTLKKAQTRMGAVACDNGSKMKITSEEQDRWSHQYLRAKHDAILVGVGTVVSDDPRLTCRIKNGELRMENCQPLRIVLDPHLRIPLHAKVVSGEMAGGTMVVIKEAKDSRESKEGKDKLQILQERGVKIIRSPVDAAGVFDMTALFRVLTTPMKDFHGITSILVEGGRKTWETFRKVKAVDCEVILIGQ